MNPFATKHSSRLKPATSRLKRSIARSFKVNHAAQPYGVVLTNVTSSDGSWSPNNPHGARTMAHMDRQEAVAIRNGRQ